MSAVPDNFWARRFRYFLENYRRDDGSVWTGAALQRATGGVATRYWVSKLYNGYFKDPGYHKIYAISKAMGVPVQAWIEDDEH